MVRIWRVCRTWKHQGVRTADIAGEIHSAIAAMDELLKQVRDMQLVAARCRWWEMFRETWSKQLTAVAPK